MLRNLVASEITKSERWLKLYRVIHNLFLKDEFIHIQDYKKMIFDMNLRITQVEANASAALSAAVSGLSGMVTAHTHMVATAGGPTNQAGSTTATIATPPVLSPAPKVPEVQIVDIGMKQMDAMLMATGPAMAPLADGFSSDQISANRVILTDIGT